VAGYYAAIVGYQHVIVAADDCIHEIFFLASRRRTGVANQAIAPYGLEQSLGFGCAQARTVALRQ